MATRLDYDRLAVEYARHRRVHPGVLARLIQGGVRPDTTVLEVGCGTGNYLGAVIAATGCRGIGVDPSAAMLAHATANRALRAAQLRPGRAESLPIVAAAVDLAFSVDVIHHVVDRVAFWREARRVLRPGGRVCTVTDSAGDIAARVPLSRYWPETVPVERARYPTIATLRAELATAGFGPIGTESVDHTYPLTDAQPYQERAFSSLHLISQEEFAQGLWRLEADLVDGPIMARSLYTLVWAEAPAAAGRTATGS